MCFSAISLFMFLGSSSPVSPVVLHLRPLIGCELLVACAFAIISNHPGENRKEQVYSLIRVIHVVVDGVEAGLIGA